jgi:hypothetical protein
MHPFVRAYKAVCKELLQPLGFKCKGRYFYRVINDVYQDLALQRFSDGQTYAVFFGFMPLCCGIESIDTIGSTFSLQSFLPLPSHANDRSDEEFDITAKKLGQLIASLIIPVYEKAITTEHAFFEWNRLEEDQWSRMDSYMRGHCCVQGIRIVIPPLIFMALAVGDYEFAVNGLRSQIAMERPRYEEERMLGEEDEKSELDIPSILESQYLKSYGRIVREYEEMIRRIETRDTEWIRQLITAKEQKSRITLGLEKPNEKG